MVSESLTVLTSGLAQDAYPLVLIMRSYFCILLFWPKLVMLSFLVLVEILLPLIHTTAFLTRVRASISYVILFFATICPELRRWSDPIVTYNLFWYGAKSTFVTAFFVNFAVFLLVLSSNYSLISFIIHITKGGHSVRYDFWIGLSIRLSISSFLFHQYCF